MSAGEHKALVRRYVDAIHRGDLAAREGMLAPNFAFRMPGAVSPLNREGFRDLFTGLLIAFPDLTVTNQESIAEGDNVANR